MQKTYTIQGMTCNGCLNSIQKRLLQHPAVTAAQIDLTSGVAILTQTAAIPIQTLQAALGEGKFTIAPTGLPPIEESIKKRSFWTTYRPLLLIVAYILGASILVQYPFDSFSGLLLMRHFMAGFFLVFSFFKLLNLPGFAIAYSRYDLLAARWKGWGYLYPFVELVLGILYLTNIAPFYTGIATILILGFSSIGVIESNLNQRKIQCACLGDVFDLPMSTVTIVEDVSMVLMAALMLFI